MSKQKFCLDCKKEISNSNWSKHIKTKVHLKNEIEKKEKEIKLIANVKKDMFCYNCNEKVVKSKWNHHVKSKHSNDNLEYSIRNLYEDFRSCPLCDKEILKKDFEKHMQTKHSNDNLEYSIRNLYENYRSCPFCNKEVLKTDFEKHMQIKHNTDYYLNANNRLPFKSKKDKKSNKRNFDINFETKDYIVFKSEEALEKCFVTLRISPKNEIGNVNILEDEIPYLMNKTLQKFPKIKLQIVLEGKFKKHIPELNDYEFKNMSISSKNKIIETENEIQETIVELLGQINRKIEGFQNNEAYYHLVNVENIDMKLREYKPIAGSSYIELPKWIQFKKACINIKNDDQKCFKYCLTYHKHKDEIKTHPERLSHYKKWENDYDYSNIKFPVTVDDIKIFCRQNNISINVYIVGEVKKKIIVPYITNAKNNKKSNHVNLLLITDNENSHYVYISNLSRLISNQLTKHEHNTNICERCFYHSSNIEVFNRHIDLCDNYFENEKAIPLLPKEKKDNEGKIIKPILKFKNYNKKFKASLVYYADLESVLRKLKHKNRLQKHEACSYAFLATGSIYENFKLYTGKSANDTINNFVDALIEEGSKLDKIFHDRLLQFKKHKLNVQEEKEFQQATVCHFCKKVFNDIDIKVRDHCHISGKFRGAAHQSCNLNVRTSLKIPVFFHNGSGYDFKHFIKKLYMIDSKLKVLSQTEEKYISISVNVKNTGITFEFKDSLRFLLKSLDAYSQVLLKEGLEKFKYVRKYFNDEPKEIQELLVQKGVFPYSYLDSFQKLESKEFPVYKEFYDNLKEKNIEINDYERGQKLWNHFKCKNFKEYMELYLKCDVLILADCFEAFREISMKTYKLDPAHYVSIPSLSWDAMLNKTQVEIDLLKDQDMLCMFMEGIRGGLSCIMQRYVKAKNKYLSKKNLSNDEYTNSYNSSNSQFLVPVDANNLYGFAMSQKLPLRNFEWCNQKELHDLFSNLPSNDSDIGYTLKVDLDYPQELHDLHNDYPFFPIHQEIKYNNLSQYQKKLLGENKTKNYKSQKLITSLDDRKGLICDYRTLKQAMHHGLKLIKIHCAIKYEQKAWLKEYIELNTELRQQSTSELEKDFYKLMNNAVYGKTIENVLKRQDIKFLCEREEAIKLISKINFKRETIFSKNFVAIHMNKMQVKFNKPIFAGFSVLEMSKWLMYDFAYNYLKPKWGSNVQIVQTDTDGLLLSIKTDDFYEDIKPDIPKWFDTSNFSENNKFGITQMNKMKLGCFKIETGENIVTDVVGLRAKMYCYLIDINGTIKLKKSEKGVPKHISQKHEFDLFKQVLNNEIKSSANFNMIRSKKLNIYTINQTKVALSNFDDKRYILDDGYTTLSHGHYLTK